MIRSPSSVSISSTKSMVLVSGAMTSASPTGCNNGGLRPCFFFYAINDPVHKTGITEHDTCLHAAYRILGNYRFRSAQFNRRQLGCLLKEGMTCNNDTGRNASTHVLSLFCDIIKGGCRAEIYNDEISRILLMGGNSVDNPCRLPPLSDYRSISAYPSVCPDPQ